MDGNDVTKVDAQHESEGTKDWTTVITDVISAALVCLSFAVVAKDTLDYVTDKTSDRPVTRI